MLKRFTRHAHFDGVWKVVWIF